MEIFTTWHITVTVGVVGAVGVVGGVVVGSVVVVAVVGVVAFSRSSEIVAMTDYPSDFENVWLAFKACPGFTPNMSKMAAYKMYLRCAEDRPPHHDLLAAIGAYGAWLRAENAKAERRYRPHPMCHPSTWLSQRRWEGFVEAQPKPVASSLPDELTVKIVAAGFGSAEQWLFEGGRFDGQTFIASSQFRRDLLRSKLVHKVHRAGWFISDEVASQD